MSGGAGRLYALGISIVSVPAAAVAVVALSAVGPIHAAAGALAVMLTAVAAAHASVSCRIIPAGFAYMNLRACVAALRLLQALRLLAGGGIDGMTAAVSNSILRTRAPLRPRPARILLLLPHCLQRHECPIRLMGSASACRRCGGCTIGDIATLADARGLALAVATGGTSARKAVRESSPDLVIAVACARDLASGLLDAWPVPAWGVANSQPHGECYDTCADPAEIEAALELLVGPQD